MNPADFICPECGSKQLSHWYLVDCEFVEGDRWSAVLQHCVCADCRYTIPAHLAERWDGISIEEAVHQWRTTYRDTAPKEANS